MGTVKHLLDTHTLLWASSGSPQLSVAAKNVIEDRHIQKFVSAVSAYEIMYKHHIGKLPGYAYVAENYFEVLTELGVYELPINARHAHLAGKFEWSHRDPFDRLLAAQSSVENLTLITNDEAFQTLPWVKVLW